MHSEPSYQIVGPWANRQFLLICLYLGPLFVFFIFPNSCFETKYVIWQFAFAALKNDCENQPLNNWFVVKKYLVADGSWWNEIAVDVQLKPITKQFDRLLKKDYTLRGGKTDWNVITIHIMSCKIRFLLSGFEITNCSIPTEGALWSVDIYPIFSKFIFLLETEEKENEDINDLFSLINRKLKAHFSQVWIF